MDQPKLERMLRLMKLMTGNVNYTVNDLAERLDTSYRSIYRYIETFKDAGLVVHKLDGGVYKLGKESRYFKDISQLVHFTDEEAHIVNQLIEGLDDTNMLKNNLRKKLSTVYNCTSMATSIVRGKHAANVSRLLEAITEHRQVVLVDYASSNTGVVRNRVVEPFGFTTNYVQAWCFEPESGLNKLFKTSRIGSVEVLDTPWQREECHEMGYIDIFRLVPCGAGKWMLDTMVCDYAGVGRFVIGLMDDIRIVDTPDLEAYIYNKAKAVLEKVGD